MKDYLLQNKLQRPSVAPDILPRPRLFDLLNEARQRPLTLISAPAGYGKSTLASRWAAECDWPSAWVSLDKDDGDLHVFLSYLLAAVESIFPNAELRTEALLEAGRLPSAQVVASHLLNDLYPFADPFILVLDDYHRVQKTPVNDLLNEILAYPPHAMHLVLLTRRDPAIPISRMRGSGLLAEIRAADLRFTPAETVAFLKERLKIPLDDATVAILDEKTEGWATGLRLAGLYLRDQDDLELRAQELSGSSGHIAEYLVGEVLSRQKPEITAFLLETSILDRFCAPLCQAIRAKDTDGETSRVDLTAERFIEWLVEENVFVIPLDDQGYWFRYHHLFQGFLQALLRKQKDDGAIAKLHTQASNWFADNDLIDEAIRHALAAGDTQAVAGLVVAHRYDLLNASQFPRMSRWMRLLPKDVIAENPLLMMIQAFLNFVLGLEPDWPTCTKEARRKADMLPAGSPDSSTLVGEIAAMQSLQDVVLGKAASVLVNSQKALQLLQGQAFFSRALAVAALVAGYQMEGRWSQSLKSFRDALAKSEWPLGIRARMWLYFSGIAFMEADSSSVLFAADNCLKTGGSTEFIQAKSNAQYYLGAIHYLRNELTEAKEYLTNVLMNLPVSRGAYVVHASIILDFIHLAECRPREARHGVQSIGADAWHLYDNFTVATRDALLVEIALRQGKVDEARRLGVGVDFDLRPPHWQFFVPRLTLIKLLLSEGTDTSLKQARTQLTELDEQMRRINRKNVRIDTLALLALACQKQGAEATALEKLQMALDLAEPGGWIRNFVDLGAPMTDLLERLNQLNPDNTHLQRVLEACRAEARRNPPSDSGAEKSSELFGQAPASILTPRETELLHLLAEGLSNNEIAARLYIAPVTVKKHLQNVYTKLDSHNRVDALRKARKLSLIAST